MCEQSRQLAKTKPLFKYLPLISNFNDNNLSLFLVQFPIISLAVFRFQAYYDNYFLSLEKHSIQSSMHCIYLTNPWYFTSRSRNQSLLNLSFDIFFSNLQNKLAIRYKFILMQKLSHSVPAKSLKLCNN